MTMRLRPPSSCPWRELLRPIVNILVVPCRCVLKRLSGRCVLHARHSSDLSALRQGVIFNEVAYVLQDCGICWRVSRCKPKARPLFRMASRGTVLAINVLWWRLSPVIGIAGTDLIISVQVLSCEPASLNQRKAICRLRGSITHL